MGPIARVDGATLQGVQRACLFVSLAATLAACGKTAPPEGVILVGETTTEEYLAIKSVAPKVDALQGTIFDSPAEGATETEPFAMSWHLQGGESPEGRTFYLDFRSGGEALLEVLTAEPTYTPDDDAWAILGPAGTVEICAVNAVLEGATVAEGPFVGAWVAFSTQATPQ
jgi:hypothetical protein